MSGRSVQVNVRYIPNNPDEYVIAIVDHTSLVHQEDGHKKLKDAMDDLSRNCMMNWRNSYNYIPVLVQQQANSQEDYLKIAMQNL